MRSKVTISLITQNTPSAPGSPSAPSVPFVPSAPSVPFVPLIPSVPLVPFMPGGPCGPWAPWAPSAPSQTYEVPSTSPAWRMPSRAVPPPSPLSRPQRIRCPVPEKASQFVPTSVSTETSELYPSVPFVPGAPGEPLHTYEVASTSPAWRMPSLAVPPPSPLSRPDSTLIPPFAQFPPAGSTVVLTRELNALDPVGPARLRTMHPHPVGFATSKFTLTVPVVPVSTF